MRTVSFGTGNDWVPAGPDTTTFARRVVAIVVVGSALFLSRSTSNPAPTWIGYATAYAPLL
jgi:hypothetical protein